MKGSIAFITGDNLGSHTIGGFTENFSSSTGYNVGFVKQQNFNFSRKHIA